MNDKVVSAYKNYREMTKSGLECETEKNTWMKLNDEYKNMNTQQIAELVKERIANKIREVIKQN